MTPLCAASTPSCAVAVCPNQLAFPPVVNVSSAASSAVGSETALIVRLNGLVEDRLSPPVTRTVKLDVPDAVGVPLITPPPLRLRPEIFL